MWELWGEVAPVPEERVHRLSGGETVEGFRVAYTPGHASHHVCYLHEETGDAYVGDVAGVRVPPYEHTLAPTPPPDIDVEAWLDSLHTVAALEPALALPDPLRPGDRRGRSPPPRALGADRRGRLGAPRRARSASSPASSSGLVEDTDPATVEAFEQAAPPDQLYQGLARYWRKRAGMTQTVEKPRVAGPGETGLGGHWRVIVLNDDHNTFEGVATRAVERAARASATTRAWRWPTRSTTAAGRSSGQGARELAEHYWEQLGGRGLTMAPLEQG